MLKKDLTLEFREKAHVSDLIFKLNGKLVHDPLIDTDEVGKKTLMIQFQNHYGFIVEHSFSIEVKDVVAPMVAISNPYVVEKNSQINLNEAIFCADDYDDDISCQIEGRYDLNKEGVYPLKIVATDHSGNVSQKQFDLKVVPKQKSSVGSKGNSSTPKSTKFQSVYRQYKTDKTEIGLDLSKWQGDVDFVKLKEQGVSFVMLKVGGQAKIGDIYKLDPKFLKNIEGALSNDIKVGVYFYSYARNELEATAQARWIVKQLENYDITLPIVFDWENWSSFSKFHISFRTLNQVAQTFIKEVERLGYEGMLYSSKYYLETIWYEDFSNVWLAYYTKNNDYEGKYRIWQVCSDGAIAGIDGFVDIDVMYLK